jgi:opacity protein-like surface antigen
MITHRVRQGLAWAACAALAVSAQPAAPAAAASSAIGVRYGWADASGEIFQGDFDLSGCNLVGVQLGLPLGPLVEAEVAGEYVREPFTFTEGLLEGWKAGGKGDYEDLTLLFTGKASVFTMFALPLRLYVGGGANVHYAEIEVDPAEVTVDQGGSGSGTLEDAVAKATGKRTRVGWHLVAGARLAPRGFPLLAFLEGRYQDPFQRNEGVPSTKSLYAGLSLAF